MKKYFVLLLVVPLIICLVIFALTAAANEGKEGRKFNILCSTYPPMDEFISCQNTMIKWYAEDHNVNLYWAETSTDCAGEVQVKNAMAVLRTTDIDGVILCSPDAKPQKTITDYCKENNIPVIGFQEPTDSPDILMYVGTVPNIHGAMCGKAMKEALIEKFGEVKGNIFIVDTTPASVTHHARTLGFISEFKDEPNVIIHREEVKTITVDASKKVTTSYLELGNDFDAGWGPSGAMPEGIIQALKDFPGAKIEDKIIIGSEAYSNVMEGVRDGYVKAVTMPAAQYQGAIALKYLLDYLNGEKLPSIGTTIDKFVIEGGIPRKGFDPWNEEYIKEACLPAQVLSLQEAIKDYPDIKEYYTYDYPFWSQDVPIITQKEGNAPWVWGNFPYNWAEEVR
jgi:ABC-type sugar transport system substrate-binding protein